MMKLMIVGRRRGGLTLAQVHRYMLEIHGAMVVRYIHERPDETPRRYVQDHVFDSSFRAAGSGAEPFTLARDFVTQVWFDNPAQAAASLQAPFYDEHLRPDEDRFVDQASVVRLAVAERELFARGAAGDGSKLFVFHRAAAGVSVDTLAAETQARWEALWADPAHGIARLVCNRVMVRPGTPPADLPGVDLVDEVWLKDEAATRALGERWLEGADAAALQPMLAPQSGFVMLARERVLFAGRAA
jgi:vanillate O-demethylase ferredoxin subunit